MSTINDEARSKESAKRAKQMPPSTQYAITVALANIMNGAFWGFTNLADVKNHIEAIKTDPNITARKLNNACLIEVNPQYLVSAVAQIDPNALTNKDLDVITKAMAEAKITMEKFLISKGKSLTDGKKFGGTVGIYCVNDTPAISYRGKSYPAFRVSLGDALQMFHHYGYEIKVNGVFIPASQAVNADAALWDSCQLAPTKTGIFIDVRSTLEPEAMKQKEAEFKARYNLK